MRHDRATIGVLLLAVLMAVVLASSLFLTPLTISDTDPSTYAVIPLLMLPLFALFYLRKPPEADAQAQDLAIGIGLFAAFLLAYFFLRLTLSYLFFSYRVDLLLMPILLASLICLIFGAKALKRFAPLLIYALFASPLLLTPLLNLNAAFASANTRLVYYILSTAVPHIAYSPPITILAAGYRIGIGESCVGVGLLLATVMLLLPLAYLFDGEIKRKALWILSAIVLFFVLNLARMSLIAALWIAYGPSSALSLLHLFAGIIVFYVVIVLMVLLLKRYGLELKRSQRKNQARASYMTPFLAAVIAFSFAYLLLTLNYTNVVYVSPYLLNTGYSTGSTSLMAGLQTSLLTLPGYPSTFVSRSGTSTTLTIENNTLSASILAYVGYAGSPLPESLQSPGTASATFEFLGSTSTVYAKYLYSNGTAFLVYNTTIPYLLSNSTYSLVDFYFVVPYSSIISSNCASQSAWKYLPVTYFANPNILHGVMNGYCIVNKVTSHAE